MNAIDLLEKQHREVEEMFDEFEDAGDGARKTKERVCSDIADHLAVHAEIEEKLSTRRPSRTTPRRSCASPWRSTSP